MNILKIDNDMRPAWATDDELTLRSSYGPYYEVRTHTGKRVIASEHLKFPCLNDALDLEMIPAKDMAVAPRFTQAVYNFAPDDCAAAPTIFEIGSFSVALDEDFAWLLGFYAAEGSVTDKDLTFCCTEAGYLDRVCDLLKSTFGTNTKLQSTKEHKDCIVREYRKEIIQWFMKECGKGFAGKVIPKFILAAPRRIALAYFFGVLDGDGNVPPQTVVDRARAAGTFPNVDVRIAMKNRSFLENLSGLLASVGVRSTLKEDTKSTTLSVITPDYERLLEFNPRGRLATQIRYIVEAGRPDDKSSHDIVPLPATILSQFREAASKLQHPNVETRRKRLEWQDGRSGSRVLRMGDHFKRHDDRLTRLKAVDFIFTYGSELRNSILFCKWCDLVSNVDIQWERVLDVVELNDGKPIANAIIPRGGELFAVSGNLLVQSSVTAHAQCSPQAVKEIDNHLMATCA